MADLKGMRIAVLATDGVEQVELTSPREALVNAGARVDLVSIKHGQIQGFNHHDKADKLDIDYTIRDVEADDYDAAMLPGGALNADVMRMNEGVRDFLRGLDEAGKPIAFICHAPWEMVSAGLVEGRRLTGYHTIRDDVVNAGGDFVDEETVEDRNWLSSRGPGDLDAFNAAMLRLFEAYGRESRGEPRAGVPRQGASHPGVQP